MGCANSKTSKPINPKINIKKNKDTQKIKAVLLGNPSVGKTSIATQYCLGQKSKQYGPTVGGVYFKKDTKSKEGEVICLNIWDTAGEQKYRSMASLDADIILLVFDLTDQNSFRQLQYWIGQLDRKIEKNQIIVFVIGNKNDLVRKISKSKIDSWLRNYPTFYYFQVSAVTGKGVQNIFSSAIQIYLSRPKKY